jgi:hypothetical protein
LGTPQHSWRRRGAQRAAVWITGVLAAILATATPGTAQSSLDLTVHGVGLSIGDSRRLTGLRLNFRDRALQRVDGINATLWKPYEPAKGVVNGLALGLPLTGGRELNGLTLGVGASADDGVRGIAITPAGVGAGKLLRGVMLAGVGLGTGGRIEGISIAGVGAGSGQGIDGLVVTGIGWGSGGDVRGVMIAGLGGGSGGHLEGVSIAGLGTGAGEGVTGVTIAGLGLGTGGDLSGLSIGGLGAGAGGRVTGVTLAGIGVGAGGDIRGLTIAGIGVGSGGHLQGLTIAGVGAGAAAIDGLLIAGLGAGAENITGLVLASGYTKVIDGSLRGATVSAVNDVRGIQHGLTIGVFNYARKLQGVQLGVLNWANNNPWPFRLLPLLNVHLHH